MDKLLKKLFEVTEASLPSADCFIVTIRVSSKANPKLSIILDGDKGISIDECAKVSRAVGAIIEDEGLIKDSYQLEVSSPGIDHPLGNPRQYQSRIGRTLALTLNDETTIEGKLEKVNSEGIEIIREIKEKGKKALPETVGVPFENIQKAMVQVSFK